MIWSLLPPSVRLSILRWLGVFRRWHIAEFTPEVIAERASKRLGDCHRCGACCGMTLTCKHLERDGDVTRCKVYGVCQPIQCGAFPLDRRDLRELGPGVRCGFHFADDDAGADPPLLRPPTVVGVSRFAGKVKTVGPQTVKFLIGSVFGRRR
eukprot:TRINITY_DN9059_c0_g1_i1.p1 TRINITY_DN9059_c0_g1~~TRINITY_DN9059_c0_g1_i1.p1  ORF type:complete len:166 (+),score=2.55 TRINITY_DN9059_c0_g1_i1:45-500(+)